MSAKPTQTYDDLIILKRRQDEFRAGYSNWRKGGLKGAIGETGASSGDAATGTDGTRAGNRNWRSGGAAGARSGGAGGDERTQNVRVANAGGLTEDHAASAASNGKSWVRFFLHPDSDFHRTMFGNLDVLPLRSATLPHLARTQVRLNKTNSTPLPAYARAVDSFHGIICHLGVGGFHRSHEAVYTHNVLLAQQADPTIGGGKRWGLVGVGLMPWDKGMADVLKEQNGLYTVLGRDTERTSGTVVGSVVDFYYAPEDPTGQKAVERLAHPATKIVSLTVTEKGYCLDQSLKLDLGNGLVKHDLEHRKERPHSAVGTICAALALRRLRGLAPFTVMSCDNLPGNGTLSRQMVLGFLAAWGDEALAAWVEARCTFPNTMVDRITPATRPLITVAAPLPPPPIVPAAVRTSQLKTTPSAAAAAAPAPVVVASAPDPFSDGIRRLVRETVGVDDKWPVIAETYMQWVVEDRFVNGERPCWECQETLFVPDVHPYEMMKLRLLNAGHSAISYSSYLIGHRFVDCAMDPDELSNDGRGRNPIPGFCAAFLEEQTPTCPPVPGVDTADYKKQLVKRFSNPYIKDTLQRLAEDGSQKLVTTMRDAALDNASQGRSVAGFAVVVACFMRYLVGVDEKGEAIAISDPRAEELTAMVRAVFGTPTGALPVSPPTEPPVAFLRAVFGDEVAASPEITRTVHDALIDLASTSARALISKYCTQAGF